MQTVPDGVPGGPGSSSRMSVHGVLRHVVHAARALVSPVVLGVRAIALDGQGRAILVRHSYMRGLYLPGGGVARGEHPEAAVMRELREEIGLVSAAPPELFALYTRRSGLATDHVAVYVVRGVAYEFRPGFEITGMVAADPAALPPDATPATRRRLAEFTGREPRSTAW